MHYVVYLDITAPGAFAARLRRSVEGLRGAGSVFTLDDVEYSVVRHGVVSALIRGQDGSLPEGCAGLVREVKACGAISSTMKLAGDYRNGNARAHVAKLAPGFSVDVVAPTFQEARDLYIAVITGGARRHRVRLA